jgi:hypothetical protein
MHVQNHVTLEAIASQVCARQGIIALQARAQQQRPLADRHVMRMFLVQSIWLYCMLGAQSFIAPLALIFRTLRAMDTTPQELKGTLTLTLTQRVCWA